jgi:hypothetical protein
VRIEVEGLKDKPDLRPNLGHIGFLVMDHHAVHDELTLLNGLQAVDTTNQGTLARTTWTADHHHLPLSNLQIDLIQDVKVSVPFVYILKRYHLVIPLVVCTVSYNYLCMPRFRAWLMRPSSVFPGNPTD